MGYRITLVLYLPFKESNTFEGKVAFAQSVKKIIINNLSPEGERVFEYFDSKSGTVSIHIRDHYEIHFYEDSFEISSSYKWSTFLMNDCFEECSLRKIFQRILDRISPQDSWIGSDYTTVQGPTLEYGYYEWLKSVEERECIIKEFDFESIRKSYITGVWPDNLYHIHNNNMYVQK